VKGRRDEQREGRKKSSPKGEARSAVRNPRCAGGAMPTAAALLAREIVIK